MQLLDLLQENFALALALAGVLGLCVGSFLNVVIHRTPLIMHREWRQESAEFWQHEPDLDTTHKVALKSAVAKDTPITLSLPPSRCPKCSHQIRWFENIPLASWLFLKGKCSDCSNPIGIRYPLVELITALLSVLVIFCLGATLQGVLALILTWTLIALSGIDFDTQLLPDRLVFPLGMLGLMANVKGVYVSLPAAVLGMLFGFLLLWGVATLYSRIMKKQAMGHGDFKLLAALGAWLGITMIPLVILLSSIIGTVIGLVLRLVHGESKPFAFGPYIAMAGFVALLWGESIIRWYNGLFVS